MSKRNRQREEVERQWNELEPKELDTLRAAMEAKKQIEMNGRLQLRFHQVMFDWHILSLLANGQVSVKNPVEYTKWNRANSMIESSDRKQQESYFEAYPEERTKWELKMKRWFSETREGMSLLRRSMDVTNQKT